MDSYNVRGHVNSAVVVGDTFIATPLVPIELLAREGRGRITVLGRYTTHASDGSGAFVRVAYVNWSGLVDAPLSSIEREYFSEWLPDGFGEVYAAPYFVSHSQVPEWHARELREEYAHYYTYQD